MRVAASILSCKMRLTVTTLSPTRQYRIRAAPPVWTLDSLGALLAKETLDEQEILKATGLPPAATLESRRLTGAAP